MVVLVALMMSTATSPAPVIAPAACVATRRGFRAEAQATLRRSPVLVEPRTRGSKAMGRSRVFLQ